MASYTGALALPITFGLGVTGPGQFLGAATLPLSILIVAGGDGFSTVPAATATLNVSPTADASLSLTPATTGSLALG